MRLPSLAALHTCARLTVCAGMLIAQAVAAAATLRPAVLRDIDAAMNDDPAAAIVLAEFRVNSATDPAQRFWALLGLVRAQNMLERHEAAGLSLAKARTALAQWPAATATHRAWLDLVDLQATWTSDEPRRARERADALRRIAATVGDELLDCAARQLDMDLLIDIDSLDEAWLAAESVERCGHRLEAAEFEAGALLSMGTIAGRGQARTQAEADEHFERALGVLAGQPARMIRSIVSWERANALRSGGRWDAALQSFTEARALSEAIADRAGIAAADIGIAEVHIKRKSPAQALPMLAEARRLLEGQDNGYRLFAVSEHSVSALASLRRPEVIAAIAQARRWDTAAVPAIARARLARAMAAGYASQGRYAQAYAETQRSDAFLAEGRGLASEVQNLRLQAQYAAAKRDAENAELRHRSESARLALVAESAKQRALWAALATLALLSAAVTAFGWRALARRRALIDLALRDELTGQPNRRAVTAYGQAQFEQARRLGVPLTLALVDLDHFKRVNDTLGHAAGDAVLRALALAARAVLRGQDRLGRWGGEEWLLVMPGTSVQEVQAVFDRLRQSFAATPAEAIDGAHGCSFSMGAASLSARTGSFDELVAACDRQLYRAKQEGRDRLCFEA